MSTMIEDLFHIHENDEVYAELDHMIVKEWEKRLKPFEECLTPAQYEEIRDAAFTAAYFAKKYSFGIGFKTAVKLVMECMKDVT